jgi:hypothetical protein
MQTLLDAMLSRLVRREHSQTSSLDRRPLAQWTLHRASAGFEGNPAVTLAAASPLAAVASVADLKSLLVLFFADGLQTVGHESRNGCD